MPSAPAWMRLGLTREEWDDCRRSALEAAMAGLPAVSARQIAVEFALAKGFDVESMLAPEAAASRAGATRLIPQSSA